MEALSHRIQSICGAGIDRAVLRVMEIAWQTGVHVSADPIVPRGDPVLSRYTEEAVRDRERFFKRPPPRRIDVMHSHPIPGGRLEQLAWTSGYQTWDRDYQSEFDRYEENGTARAECTWHDPETRPTIICLHPWMAGGYRLQRRIFLRRYLYDLGFNVILFVLPFHGERTPAGAWFSGQLFPGRCPRRTNEGFGQLIWDLRTLKAHILERGAGPVGALGMSLGGYAAALFAGLEPDLAFSVPIIPFSDLAALMWFHGAGRPERLHAETGGRTLEEMQALYAIHAPLEYRPLIPIERRMVIAGAGDRICGEQQVQKLWEHWERPEIHRWPGSHVAHFGREKSFEVVGRFLKRAIG
jgi:alpha/beta hydrolase family protein